MNKKFMLMVFFIILLFPFVTKAEENHIKIKSVELVEKTDKVVELENAKFENLEVWMNLKFFELNDSVKYKLVIENTSDKEYKFNNDGDVFTEEKYISYTFDFEDAGEVFEPGSEKTMYVTIKYETEVSDADYIENVYTNDNYMNFSFDVDEEEQEIVLDTNQDSISNPNTEVGSILIASFIAIIALIILVHSFKKKNLFFGIILLILLIPVVSKALELYKIQINVYVEIEKEIELGTFKLTCVSDEYFTFEKGMTFSDWMQSDYVLDYNIRFFGDTFSFSGADGPAYFTDPDVNDSTEIIDGTIYGCDDPPVAECVAPDSKIMITLDGYNKLAKDIKENDTIIYYDFETNTIQEGKVDKVYVHKDAMNFIKYTLEDNSYIEATDYHPIYTIEGWKSYTNRNGYPVPVVGDKVKTKNGWKKIIKIETYNGIEDFYDFRVISNNGEVVDNYFANEILVHSAY